MLYAVKLVVSLAVMVALGGCLSPGRMTWNSTRTIEVENQYPDGDQPTILYDFFVGGSPWGEYSMVNGQEFVTPIEIPFGKSFVLSNLPSPPYLVKCKVRNAISGEYLGSVELEVGCGFFNGGDGFGYNAHELLLVNTNTVKEVWRGGPYDHRLLSEAEQVHLKEQKTRNGTFYRTSQPSLRPPPPPR